MPRRKYDKIALERIELGLDEPDGTLNELFEAVYADRWRQTKTGTAVRRLYLRYVAPRLGHRSVRTLRYADLARFHAAGKATPVQANRAMALISTLFNEAERRGRRDLHSNPCGQIPRYRELRRYRVASSAELARIETVLAPLQEIEPVAVAFLRLLLLTGIRPKELWHLKKEQVIDNVAHLPDAKTGPRKVYMPPEALAILSKLTPDADGFYFPLGREREMRAFWQAVRDNASITGLRMYDLRRTFATIGMSVTRNIGLIGEMLGHADIDTTKIYAKAWDEAAQDAAKQIGAKISSLMTTPTQAAGQPESDKNGHASG